MAQGGTGALASAVVGVREHEGGIEGRFVGQGRCLGRR